MPSRSEDIFFSVFLSVNFLFLFFIGQNNFLVASPTKDFSLQKYVNRFDLHIVKTFEGKFYLFEERAFYFLNYLLKP